MKNRIVTIALTLLTIPWVYAQEYKVAKNSGRIEINLGKVAVEGYNGNEIIFSSEEREKERDERAAGLKEINSVGLDDNTGLGINVTEKDGVVTVKQLNKTNSKKIRIQVPKGVIVSFSYESQYGNDVSFKNIESEIEISAQYNSINIDNCTGPMTIKSVYGSVDVNFGSTIKGPISIISVYGHADVTLPVATKANLKLSTSYGQIYVAPDFKIEIDKQGDMIRYSDRVSGKINGGGIDMDITCNYGKVYLRKK
jgi:predicted membrane protein